MLPLRHKATRKGLLRQGGAALLLFLFLSDIGFHALTALFAAPEATPSSVLLAGAGGPWDPEGHSGCGIPGHGDSPFHHHHFPAILKSAAFVMAVVVSPLTQPASLTTTVSVTQTRSPIRAPPSS